MATGGIDAAALTEVIKGNMETRQLMAGILKAQEETNAWLGQLVELAQQPAEASAAVDSSGPFDARAFLLEGARRAGSAEAFTQQVLAALPSLGINLPANGSGGAPQG